MKNINQIDKSHFKWLFYLTKPWLNLFGVNATMAPVTTMAHILQITQIVSSILLIILVLLQKASPDMGATLGGDGSSFLQTRRGAERFLFILTIVVAVVFAGASLAAVVIQ